MRLLRHASDGDFELVTFDSDPPPYAILSHTWGKGQEVTYDEFIAGEGRDKPGFDKIRFCGERAACDGIEHFWVDTCCIDKASSAELSESINSMYRWYQEAEICYAFIEDWSLGLDWADLCPIMPDDDLETFDKLYIGSDVPCEDDSDDTSEQPGSTRFESSAIETSGSETQSELSVEQRERSQIQNLPL